MSGGPYWGKYKGKAGKQVEGDTRGRIYVTVEDILKDPAPADPCVPWAADKMGFFFIPPDGADIWVEFAGGDRTHPIWTGCFWGPDAAAPTTYPPDGSMGAVYAFVTSALTVKASEETSGKKLEITFDGVSLTLEKGAITIDAGSGGTVTISGTKLEAIDKALSVGSG